MRIKSVFTSALTAVLIVGAAWAGIGLAPVGDATPVPEVPRIAGPSAPAPLIGDGVELGADELLVGAAKVSLKPEPNEAAGEVWVRDRAKCVPHTSGDANNIVLNATDLRSPWIEHTGCIYMGGFGIGPSQPVIEWDDYEPATPVVQRDEHGVEIDVNLRGYGLWSRSAAFMRPDASGTMRAVVVTILDAEGYFAAYNRMCPPELACGVFDLQEQLGAELGLDPASFIFASTHAHSAMDFIGGWGGVPSWYMRQVAEAMRESVRQAVTNAVPATLEAGETFARQFNGERRDTYRSAEDPSVNWVRALDRDGKVVTTVGTFSAHATSFGGSATLAHADWPGVWDKRVEERFGGTGLMFEAGLGNMSSRGGYRMGRGLAEIIPAPGAGTLVRNPAVRVKMELFDQPVTNIPLGTLGSAGLFDRPFAAAAAQVTAGKSGSRKPCVSASPVSVRTSVTAAKVGNVIFAAAPGEIFSNFSNTIEELPSISALVLGQANDALGYMPQQFETDHAAREGLGFAGSSFFEYEDAYSIDHCFGDRALDGIVRLVGELG